MDIGRDIGACRLGSFAVLALGTFCWMIAVMLAMIALGVVTVNQS